jgi:hypothetical protein
VRGQENDIPVLPGKLSPAPHRARKRGHMQRIRLSHLPPFPSMGGKRSRKILLLILFGLVTGALATPPFGFLLNQILAMGSTMENISQQIQISGNPDSSDEKW